MVARPPVRVSIEPMGLEDVAAVHSIEAASFPTPWPDYAFRQEIQTNRLAHYLVVRAGDETIGQTGAILDDQVFISVVCVRMAREQDPCHGRGNLTLDDDAHPARSDIAGMAIRARTVGPARRPALPHCLAQRIA